MPHFRLVGYRGVGKDTFYDELATGRLTVGPGASVRWEVYSTEPQAWREFERLFQAGVPKMRLAFADALKDDVHRRLGLPLTKRGAGIKDAHLVDGLTVREHYKRRALLVKSNDPDHYVRIVARGMRAVASRDARALVVVTDQRYRNEHLVDGVTVRLFRSTVPTPPPDDDSEHELDACLTDILLVSPGDLDAAVRAFPQYGWVVPRGAVREVAAPSE